MGDSNLFGNSSIMPCLGCAGAGDDVKRIDAIKWHEFALIDACAPAMARNPASQGLTFAIYDSFSSSLLARHAVLHSFELSSPFVTTKCSRWS